MSSALRSSPSSLDAFARGALVTLLAAVFTTLALGAPAPSPPPDPVDEAERAAVVDRIGRMLNDRYVFPEVGRVRADRLAAGLDAGAFDDVRDPEAFAVRLTESLQRVSHDKHMRVRVRRVEAPTEAPETPARAQARRIAQARAQNFGFERVERLDGNVGYLDLRFFAAGPEARATAAAAMNFLAHADALIFDMRRNGGGNPGMVRFISSYLFDEPTHLNSLYFRAGDVTEEFWTLADVPGPKMADVPVFVLTSAFTFSGAEEFSYNLRTRDRATLVGETTGGGANPGDVMPINGRFEIFIPTGRAINPVTGTNWEGTGVTPHVEVAADAALDAALERARPAAAARRRAREERAAAGWDAFDDARHRAIALDGTGDDAEAARVLTAGLAAARADGLVGEADINMIGYGFLGDGRAALAVAAFEFNVSAFPESANVYDSLGEACLERGEVERAIANYERALELDPENEHARATIAALREKR